MKKTVLAFLAILLFSAAFSQGGFYITGALVDSANSKPAELATVVLKNSDDKLVAGAVAGSDGKFMIEKIAAGQYSLSISLIGFNNKTLPLNISANVELGTVQLSPSAQNLKEAVITADKNVITKNSEKTVFNVAQSPTNQTGTGEDVLRNMPGVSVDRDGNVSIIGKQGVKVLVDGRPNALAESNLAAFLKSIPASSIEAIELITNPSARYDAEGNAGIINIKLKKGKADGLNGNISAGYGILNRYNGNFVLNYRKNKFNYFINYSLWVGKNPNRFIEDRVIKFDTVTHYKMDSRGRSENISNNLKTGFDYFINDKNTLTYTVGGNFSLGRWYTDAIAENRNNARQLLNSYHTYNDDRNRNFTVTNQIDYQKTFDSTERAFSLSLIYNYVQGRSNAPFQSLAYDGSGIYSEVASLTRRTNSFNNINNGVVQMDYVHPLKWKGYKFETGLKNETTLNRNTFNAYRTIANVESKDTLLSNGFDYTENIGALYFIFSGAFKKYVSWNVGLRGEHTFIKSNNSAVSRNYFSFFPNATINVEISEKQNLSASYSRRVQRPQFREINNSVTYIDQYSTWQGNPTIQPAFSHNISVNYNLFVKQHMFSWEAIGRFEKGGFLESSRVDTNRITRGGIMNGADNKMFAINFYSKLQLTKWWTFQMNHGYSFNYYSYSAGINTMPIKGHAYNLWLSTSWKFWKNMSIEINGWFNSRSVHTQGISLPVGSVNASIKKSFFKDRFTVSISAQNIFNTMKWRWTVDNGSLETVGSWHALNRVVFINLSYRFGTGKATERKGNDNSRLEGGKSR